MDSLIGVIQDHGAIVETIDEAIAALPHVIALDRKKCDSVSSNAFPTHG